jgi:hypothetical protein
MSRRGNCCCGCFCYLHFSDLCILTHLREIMYHVSCIHITYEYFGFVGDSTYVECHTQITPSYTVFHEHWIEQLVKKFHTFSLFQVKACHWPYHEQFCVSHSMTMCPISIILLSVLILNCCRLKLLAIWMWVKVLHQLCRLCYVCWLHWLVNGWCRGCRIWGPHIGGAEEVCLIRYNIT